MVSAIKTQAVAITTTTTTTVNRSKQLKRKSSEKNTTKIINGNRKLKTIRSQRYISGYKGNKNHIEAAAPSNPHTSAYVPV